MIHLRCALVDFSTVPQSTNAAILHGQASIALEPGVVSLSDGLHSLDQILGLSLLPGTSRVRFRATTFKPVIEDDIFLGC
jgi:hypothetical protein